MRKHGRPKVVLTDSRRSCGAALGEMEASNGQEIGQWLNNRVENSHLPFLRRERTPLCFGQRRCHL
jgi:putative transposase